MSREVSGNFVEPVVGQINILTRQTMWNWSDYVIQDDQGCSDQLFGSHGTKSKKINGRCRRHGSSREHPLTGGHMRSSHRLSRVTTMSHEKIRPFWTPRDARFSEWRGMSRAHCPNWAEAYEFDIKSKTTGKQPENWHENWDRKKESKEKSFFGWNFTEFHWFDRRKTLLRTHLACSAIWL